MCQVLNKFLQIFILTFLIVTDLRAQEKPPKQPLPPYNRKEEIIYDSKRYRVYNNYLTIGGGFLNSTIRTQSQKCLALDFQFHIKRQYFQAGAMMSGPDFGNNNNIMGHLGYGLRREKNTWNAAAFLGPSYSTGVEGVSGSPAEFYDGFGIYGSVQGVTKFLYDVGIGLELFGDISQKQQMFGFKIIAFFSGAYKGAKRNYNPNVRSENPQ